MQLASSPVAAMQWIGTGLYEDEYVKVADERKVGAEPWGNRGSRRQLARRARTRSGLQI